MPQNNRKLLIKGGTVIDGTGREPFQASMLIEGNRINAIGPEIEKQMSGQIGDFQVVQANGKTVMPGLIDAHCHITYGEIYTQEESDISTGVEYRSIRAAWNAQKLLRAGVTSISDPGCSWNIGVAVRDAILAGMVEGPRMTTAGRYLTTHQGIADFFPSWLGVPISSIGVLTNTKDEMLTQVRRQVKEGVDLIKVAASGDNYNAYTSADVPAFAYEELRAIVEEAHRLGKKVTVHARSGASAVDAARAEVDWVMHASLMNEKQLDEYLNYGVPICPTLTLMVNIAEWGEKAGVDPHYIEATKQEVEAAANILSQAHKAGIKFLAGTDSGFILTPYGHWHARELEIFVRYLGFTPMEAIIAGTKNNAMTVNLDGEVGTLESGKLADVIVVDGDPLKDIRILQDLRRIQFVIKDGKIVDLKHPWPERKVWRYERSLTFATNAINNETVNSEPVG